jgi:hypothetical protein
MWIFRTSWKSVLAFTEMARHNVTGFSPSISISSFEQCFLPLRDTQCHGICTFYSPWETLSQTLADALSTKFDDVLINMLAEGTLIIILVILKWKPQLWHAVSPCAPLAWAMSQ